MSDAVIRKAFLRGHGEPIEPMSVWQDSDHSSSATELGPNLYPRWEECTEALKMFIAFDVGMELGCGYSFTAHIAPDLVTSWSSGSLSLMGNIEQRLRRRLKAQGLSKLAFCYVVETRTKWGRSRTRPHLHGFLLAETPLDPTRFKVALEQALNPTLLRHGRKGEVEVVPSYDWKEEFLGRARWVSYFTKNVSIWDQRLGKRRVYMSHELIRLAREAWALRREEPIT